MIYFIMILKYIKGSGAIENYYNNVAILHAIYLTSPLKKSHFAH